MEIKKQTKENSDGTAKEKVRERLKREREMLSKEQVQQDSEKICMKLRGHIWFWHADTVCFYYPLGNEVNLLPLAQEALACGMKVAFPRVHGEVMDFHLVSSLGDFAKGCFQVMEPTGGEMIQSEEPLVLVPGVGFDFYGNRMGYGQGYYDRYFSKHPSCRKVGIAYSQQLVESLPKCHYDVHMDGIVTEQGYYKGRK